MAAFFAIDMVWLGLAARSFYQQHLGFLIAPTHYDLTNLATLKDWPVLLSIVSD